MKVTQIHKNIKRPESIAFEIRDENNNDKDIPLNVSNKYQKFNQKLYTHTHRGTQSHTQKDTHKLIYHYIFQFTNNLHIKIKFVEKMSNVYVLICVHSTIIWNLMFSASEKV